MKKWSTRITCLAAAVLLTAALSAFMTDAKAASDTVTITFHADGGYGTLPEPLTGTLGENVVVPAAQLTCPEPAWLFAGWTSRAGSGVEYCPGDTIVLTGNQTLYAIYSKQVYTVEYHVGDTVTSEQVTPGGSLQEIPDLSESGYTAWTNSDGRRTELDGAQIWRSQTVTAVPDTYIEPVTLKTSASHDSYMNGYTDGLFQPNAALTRAELAQILYALIEERPQTDVSYPDVDETAWYAPAIHTLSALDILNGDESGFFYPDQAVTRAECAAVLSRTLPADVPEEMPFLDIPEDFWAYSDIARVCGYGLFRGDGSGNFFPEDSLTRAEAVTAFNRLLGRSADTATLASSNTLRIFPDVPASFWAYADIMEASTAHVGVPREDGGETWAAVTAGKCSLGDGYYTINGSVYCVQNGIFLYNTTNGYLTYDENGRAKATLADGYHTINGSVHCVQNGMFLHHTTSGYLTYDANGCAKAALADGYYRLDGWLYCVKNGMFLYNTTDGYFTFDAYGRYTTGNADLDQRLNAIVDKYTNSSMTQDQKLRALYNYVRDNFTYLMRPLLTKDQTGWEPEYALFFLQNGKGNCYSFSAAYCLLCRELGLPAYTVVGGLGASASPHGWVEIVLDGTRYMFDTELEWRYLHDYNRTGYDLFKMIPGQTRFTYVW